MNKTLKKHLEANEKHMADLDRMNCNCLPPFGQDGMMMSSYLCQVRKGRNYPLYTYVYAPDEESAKDMLDDQYPDFDFRQVGLNKNFKRELL